MIPQIFKNIRASLEQTNTMLNLIKEKYGDKGIDVVYRIVKDTDRKSKDALGLVITYGPEKAAELAGVEWSPDEED